MKEIKTNSKTRLIVLISEEAISQSLANRFSNELEAILMRYPENDNHPKYQVEIACEIAIRINRGEKILLITHSPYIVDHLNNLLTAFQVGKEHPETNEQQAKIIPVKQWLNPLHVVAYKVNEIVEARNVTVDDNQIVVKPCNNVQRVLSEGARTLESDIYEIRDKLKNLERGCILNNQPAVAEKGK